MNLMLLALDIDGTLAHRAAPSLWRALVDSGDLWPIEDAQQALADIDASRVVFVTSRSEALRQATLDWLRRHYPSIAAAPLLMRADDDLRDGWEVKRDAIDSVRQGRSVVLADDEEVGQALRPGDRLLVAPDCWRSD